MYVYYITNASWKFKWAFCGLDAFLQKIKEINQIKLAKNEYEHGSIQAVEYV